MKLNRALLFLALLFVVSCATVYQPVNPHDALADGYSEKHLAPDSWWVSFQGNNLTSIGTIRALLLRRCAELTDHAGYTHFAVEVSESQRVEAENMAFPDLSRDPWSLPFERYLNVRTERTARPSGWALV